MESYSDVSQFNYQTKNRFHAALRLFSDRSQMTSECGKKKKVADEAIAESFTNSLTTFTEQTHGKMKSTCFIQ